MAVAAAFSTYYTDQMTDWLVMTDEMLYERLAISMAETGSPLPAVHGVHVQVLSILYPLLIAPIYGAFGVPEALHAVHLWNSVLMATAAIPAYLLARDVLRTRIWALAVAGLTVSVPWTVLSGFVLTENAAYPAFLWAVVAMQRSLAKPGPRWDALALLALAVAFLARTQFIVLMLTFPLAVLVHSMGWHVARAAGERHRAAQAGAREAIGAHRVLVLAYGAAAPIAVVLAGFGLLGNVLGSYSAATGKGVLPPLEVFRAAAVHLDDVALVLGVVPFLLATGWLVTTLTHPREREGHAFAALAALVIAAVTFQGAWFDLSFPSVIVIRDRYLFYVAPLLFVGMIAAVRDHRSHWIGVLGAAVLVVSTIHWTPFLYLPGLFLDALGLETREWVSARSAEVGIDAKTLVALAVLLGAAALVFALRSLRRNALGVSLTVLVFVVCFAQTGNIFYRLVTTPIGVSGRPIAGDENGALAWIDRAVPKDADVGILPYPANAFWPLDAVLWWDVEFWNKRVDRTLLVNGEGLTYTPETFPTESLRLDPFSGAAGAPRLPSYVVMAATDVRMRLAGTEVAAARGLELWKLVHPARADWLTVGLDLDGATLAGLPPQIRLFGSSAKASSRLLAVTLRAVPGANKPRPYALQGPTSSHAGVVPPRADVTATLPVCVRPGRTADVTLSVPETSTVPGVSTNPPPPTTREVGLRVIRIDVRPVSGGC